MGYEHIGINKASWKQNSIKIFENPNLRNLSNMITDNLLPVIGIVKLASGENLKLSWYGQIASVKMKTLPYFCIYFKT